MIQKFSYGEPVETGAVVSRTDCMPEGSAFPFGTVVSNFPFRWMCTLGSDDFVFGLGESMRGINKRGFKYVSWCSDVPNQNEFTASMYGAHNLVIVYGAGDASCRALFFDTASRVTFDIGYTEYSTFTVETAETGVDVYVITPDEGSGLNVLQDVVRQFRQLIGQSYIPPRWAFGFQQSRWGYKTEDDIRKVVSRQHGAGLPIDAVCIDIDYMDAYKDFTVDAQKFPDMAKLSADMREEGVHLVPIIDAGVKRQQGYDVYEEGCDNGYFCKKEDGSDFVAGVWPGRSCFPDFLNPAVRSWFGGKYRRLTELGIDGFWNDMNEPAMFYSDESLEETFRKLQSYQGQNLDVQTFFEFTPLSGSTFNRLDDYRRFYHEIPAEGGGTKKIRHDLVHNLYGANMTRAAAESLREISPDKRMLLYSRASCVGAHRYGGIWTGDNASCWAHLQQEIKMLPSLNMVGFLYSGADIGGFGESTTRDLLLRWLALGAFTPLMRNHCAWNNRSQECYAFGNTDDFKSLLDFRYALVPYIYSEFVKAALGGTMYIRPLGFDFPTDMRALRTEDQLLVGEGILIAPVYEQNADGRYVYLPEDMTKVCWCRGKISTEEKKRGSYYIRMPLDTVTFFVRKDRLVPLCQPPANTAALDTSSFTLVGTGTSYSLYEDDGYTRTVTLEGRMRTLER